VAGDRAHPPYRLRALIYLAHDPEDGYHQTRDVAKTLNVDDYPCTKFVTASSTQRRTSGARPQTIPIST
jgi:hypothetical protein